MDNPTLAYFQVVVGFFCWDRKEGIMNKPEEREFIPKIEIKFDQVPRPIFVASLAPKIWKIRVRVIIRELNMKKS